MKAQIPDALKADMPQTKWGKVLVATPVIMTVIATLLAGLASSEMTRAQYERSLAAQLQSKAGDQWSYFQAKRLRGAMQRSTLDLLQSAAPVRRLTADALKPSGEVEPATLAALLETKIPEAPAMVFPGNIQTALEAVERSQPESEIAGLLAKVKARELDGALKAARERALAFDAALKPVTLSIERLEQAIATGASAETLRDFIPARLRFAAARYDAEAKLNQAIANVLELQVRQGNLSAERHHRRSGQFFYGMLAAQAAVIIATFSLAAQKRSFLWSIAAAAGLAAIAFAVYVYLCI